MSSIEIFSRDSRRLSRPFLLAAHLTAWRSLRKQRANLSKLDARALDDIGLTRSDANTEARRPFWDVPESWRD
ncbi:DUF1127 domain-containing protein [Rhodobacteraceae bacterium D3-12]|nr:DUF1127 domain-containing protein [Rhodobacteraceae bacterium D3-12]